ncbi:ras family-domain-containing protein [Mycena rebaudengoi]|nr:ras family-domain-containing protein [Mycena rebaudengoi]
MPLCGASSRGAPFGRAKPIQRKVVVCGDGACGKTSLLNVFTRGFFSQVYEPTVFENYVHDILVDDQQVELSLWDTAGQEEFDRLRSLSYAETHVIMICFSVDNPISLENVETKWLEEILEYCPGVKLVLVALKCDLRDDRPVRERLQRYGTHPVQYEEGLAVARRIRASRYLAQSITAELQRYFWRQARVSLSTRPKGPSDGGCVVM